MAQWITVQRASLFVSCLTKGKDSSSSLCIYHRTFADFAVLWNCSRSLSRHTDLAVFISALIVLLHFSKSWELFMDTRAWSSPLKQLVHLQTIHGYGMPKSILFHMEMMLCSLACPLYENNIFNKIISPEELLRCLEFIPTHSGPQKIVQIYYSLLVMRVAKFFTHLKI